VEGGTTRHADVEKSCSPLNSAGSLGAFGREMQRRGNHHGAAPTTSKRQELR